MIEMVRKYMRGDATRMETYIDLGAVVNEFKHRKGIFARRDLSMAAIRAMHWHADFYDLPDDTRDATYADSSSKGKIQGRRGHHQCLRTTIADHLTDFQLGGDGDPMHHPKGPPHV